MDENENIKNNLENEFIDNSIHKQLEKIKNENNLS